MKIVRDGDARFRLNLHGVLLTDFKESVRVLPICLLLVVWEQPSGKGGGGGGYGREGVKINRQIIIIIWTEGIQRRGTKPYFAMW